MTLCCFSNLQTRSCLVNMDGQPSKSDKTELSIWQITPRPISTTVASGIVWPLHCLFFDHLCIKLVGHKLNYPIQPIVLTIIQELFLLWHLVLARHANKLGMNPTSRLLEETVRLPIHAQDRSDVVWLNEQEKWKNDVESGNWRRQTREKVKSLYTSMLEKLLGCHYQRWKMEGNGIVL